ncbi:transporter substrate-binding domain-containing protein [Shewanella woodyi]|uniref:transporter substrate-binding domain-containing protein n=1 Tax=Shewanella woodyi TaxID=60961 RepID=UPI003749FC56
MKLFIKCLSVFFFLLFTSVLEANDKKPLVIVMGADSYPYQFIGETGEPEGLLVDLWRAWSQQVGEEVVFVARYWKEGLEQLDSGQASVHIGMAVTDKRQQRFDFATPISTVHTHLYLHKTLNKKHNIEELQPYHVGIVSGSSHEASLLALSPKLTFKYYKNRNALLQAALVGEVLVFAGMEGQIKSSKTSRQVAELFPNSSRLLIKQVGLSPAVKHGKTQLLAKINSGFALLDNARIREIEAHWLGIAQEQEGVRVAATLDIEPYVNLGVDGRPHGLYVDIWDLWSEKTGIPVSYATGDMNSSLDFVRKGKADVHIGYPESDALKSGLQRVQLLYQVKSRLFSVGAPIDTLSAINQTRIGAVPTAPYLDKLKQIFPEAELKLYDSVDAMIEAAQAGNISSFVASSAWTQHYLVQKGVGSDFYQFMDLEFNTDIFVLSQGGNSGLTKRIKQGFALISQEELAEIEQKWVLDSNNRIYTDKVHLLEITEQDKAYLANMPPLKVGYLANWKPMEFTNQAGIFSGVNSELVGLLRDKLAIEIKAVEYPNWQSLISALLKGEVELAGSVAKTQDRSRQLLFSEPYWPAPWALATGIDKESVFNIQQLSGQRVAIVEGYQLINELLGSEYGIELVLVADTEAGLKAVSDGLADAFIEKVINMAAQLKHQQVNQLKMSVLADFSEQHSHFGVHPDRARLVPLINKVLSGVNQPMRQDIYRNWVSKTAAEPSRISYWACMIICVFLIIFITLFIFVKFLLSREVKKRKELEEKLLHLTNYDTLTLLPNRSLLDDRLEQAILLHARELGMFAVLFIDFSGIKSVNTELGHQVGDQLMKKLAQGLRQSVRRSDTVARFSSDEFVVILNRTKDLDIVCQVAETIISNLSKSFEIEQVDVNVITNIGIAMYPADGDVAVELLKTADELMSRAKKVVEIVINHHDNSVINAPCECV